MIIDTNSNDQKLICPFTNQNINKSEIRKVFFS